MPLLTISIKTKQKINCSCSWCLSHYLLLDLFGDITRKNEKDASMFISAFIQVYSAYAVFNTLYFYGTIWLKWLLCMNKYAKKKKTTMNKKQTIQWDIWDVILCFLFPSELKEREMIFLCCQWTCGRYKCFANVFFFVLKQSLNQMSFYLFFIQRLTDF